MSIDHFQYLFRITTTKRLISHYLFGVMVIMQKKGAICDPKSNNDTCW